VFGTFNVGGGAREKQPVAVGANAYSQALFERREILIELSEEADAIYQIA
jgi:hypothetical protein